MTKHSDDLDDLLRRAASDYNRPGEVPRDRMWAEIRARRAQSRQVTPLHSRRRLWYASAAAAAVLVLGFAIGRGYEQWRGHNQTSVTTVARVDSNVPAPVVAVSPGTSRPDSLVASAKPLARPNDNRVPAPHAPTGLPRSRPFAPGSATTAYRLAVVEHLAGTEAMLVSFRAAAKRGEVDAQITNWARNLLTTTRLLQGSAAQEDPTMKRLLDDLELVLVQIAQYTSAGPHHAEELELIEHSIERRGVVGKLHTTMPARLSPAGA
jgi:hypothetical protein